MMGISLVVVMGKSLVGMLDVLSVVVMVRKLDLEVVVLTVVW
jgi:hypothetical protein